MTVRRKLAIATWSAPREGNIYGKLTLDATEALAYIDRTRETSGERITLTHFVGKVVAEGLKIVLSLNGRIRLGRYVPHDQVGLAFLVALPESADLAKAKLSRVDEMSVADIARELRKKAESLRGGKDPEFEKSKGLLRALPTWMLRPIVWFSGFLTGSLGVELKALGLEAFPFGSAIVTSIGMMGVDEGFAPPTPFARVPLYVVVGAVREQPAVVDGKIAIRPQITLCATIDHRFVDGLQVAKLVGKVRELFADPWSLNSP